MTNPTPLNPAAQAVLSAAEDAYGYNYSEFYCCADRVAAAALRAAADQVVPEIVNAVGDEHDEARLEQWMRIRYKFLAIAAELENYD